MTGGALAGRVALVTGASRGIGAAVALELSRMGAHVVLIARRRKALEAMDDDIRKSGGAATLMPLNLEDPAKLDPLGPALYEKFGRLDILVGNAGILGTLGPLPHADPAEWERVMNVNLNANFRLIRTLDPLLRASDAGRAVFVTSGMGEETVKAYWSAYAVSKAALGAMVRTYAAETEKTALRVNIVRPGIVDTGLLREAYPGGYAEGPVRTPEEVAPHIAALTLPECTRHGENVDLFGL